MSNQALFSLKDESKKLNCYLLQVCLKVVQYLQFLTD